MIAWIATITDNTGTVHTCKVNASNKFQAESKAQLTFLGRFPNQFVPWPNVRTEDPNALAIEHKVGDTYRITGVLVNGRRFKAIETSSLRHALGINLWNGSVWQIRNGKRTLIKRVSN